jgi:hypothetical protein
LTPRGGKEFREEIAEGKRILRSLRRTLPRTRITWIEGNHEFRLRRYLIQNARVLYGVPGLTVPELFGLKALGIEYVACHPLASKFTDNFIRVGSLYVGHWDKVSVHGGYAAKSLVETKGVSLLQGHTHRFGAHARTTVDGRVRGTKYPLGTDLIPLNEESSRLLPSGAGDPSVAANCAAGEQRYRTADIV